MKQNQTVAVRCLLIRLLAGCAGLALAYALLACSTASAAPVNGQTAADAVVGWLRLDHQPMGGRMSAVVRNTETVNDAAGVPLYHIVHLDPAGYVIMPADDAAEPIIAFSASGKFVSSSRDPVVALVNRDLPQRMRRTRAGARDARATEAHGKWQAMLAASPNPPADSEENSNIVAVSQVWVAPFVQTLWSQNNDVTGADAVYDYYVPPNAAGNPNNFPCGCVATCLAQLMYYYQYPNVGVGTNSFSITVTGNDYTNTYSTNLMGGNGAGGPYQWSNMPLSPNSPTATEAQAIGALCSDAGVAVNMNYAVDGSSAFTYLAQVALTNTFKFSNADYDEMDSQGLSGSSFLSMINPNLDARLPVSLGISGPEGGHCLIADGYGYTGSTLFHHVNAGWGGDDDVWYALPNIITPDNDTYNIVQACIYNIYTNGTGQIISGRVTDPTGAPVVGAAITATRTAGGIYTATTDTNGVYALARIPASSQYGLTVTLTGYALASGNYSTGLSSYDTTNSGNVWGANFTLSPLLLAVPETGFTAVGPVAGPFSVTSQTYTLTNTAASSENWALSTTAAWLSMTASNGTLAAGAASSLTVSLNATASSMTAGTYTATVLVTNLTDHFSQSLPFTLSVKTADYPISVTGFDADVVIENTATGGNAPLYAQQFDADNINVEGPTAFYEAGLTAANLQNGNEPATEGLPQSGLFTSQLDGATTFQFGPYNSNNVLYLVPATNIGTLTLTSPAAYQSLSILAASAQGGGSGSLVLHFVDNSSSTNLAFLASDYQAVYPPGAEAGAALTNFGIALTGNYNEFYADDQIYNPDYYFYFPVLYQTSVNLKSQGLYTKQISSVTFTMPGGTNANMVTGIFALSGTESPFPVITSQPQSVAVASGGNAALSVGVAGAATLSYHWYFNGSPLTGAQSNPLNLTGVGATNAGSYQVVITNASGSVTSAVAVLDITNVAVSFLTGANAIKYSGSKLTLQLTNLTGQGPVVVSASTNLLQWVPIFTNPSGFGTITVTDTAAGTFPHRYYRATTP